jgi:tRNA 2-thiouridine synthesizing protein C
MATTKSWLILFRHGPFGSSYAREGLDTALVMGAFDQNPTVIFEGDALLLLLKSANSDALNLKSISKGFSALPMYGIEQLCVRGCDLERLGLTPIDLSVPVEVLSDDDLRQYLHHADHVLSF